MPMWGDKTHDWAAIEACVDIMYEVLSDHVTQAKEKFGYLRCYVSTTIDGCGWVKWFVMWCGWRWIGIRRWLFDASYRRNGRDKSISFRMLGVQITRSSREAISKKVKERMEAAFVDTYRQAYERCVAEYPHMAKYILMDADYPELLVGIVPEAECKHPGWWSGGGEWRCGVCMKVVTEDLIKKEEE